MKHPTPWSDHETLTRVLARWHHLYAGRDLFRVAAGDQWVRLHLAGDERQGLLLGNLPGARIVCGHTGRLAAPLDQALNITRKHPLPGLLNGAQLLSCGMMPQDLVAAFHFSRKQESDLVLLHQMFGARGNSVLLDRAGKRLWSMHRPVHQILNSWPSRTTWTTDKQETSTEPPSDFDAQVLEHLAATYAEQVSAKGRTALSRRLKATERLIANLGRDLSNADQGDLHRRKAEALAANLHTMTQGPASIVLSDLRDNSPLTITLDPARNPAGNMEAWFRRARKAEKGLKIIRTRHTEATEYREQLDTALAKLSTAGQGPTALKKLAALQQWQTQHQPLLPDVKKRTGKRASEAPARPFRRYVIDKNWEVWVGRNNKENDQLTHKAAHNRDIWLHAQGVSGSHVIIRTGGSPELVPRPVLEKAAALAALNSKARNSQFVPVIYTEKRYVRKPRKALPGTAVCLRDENLFVEPGIKTGVEPAAD